jgi:hypothetical protein
MQSADEVEYLLHSISRAHTAFIGAQTQVIQLIEGRAFMSWWWLEYQALFSALGQLCGTDIEFSAQLVFVVVLPSAMGDFDDHTDTVIFGRTPVKAADPFDPSVSIRNSGCLKVQWPAENRMFYYGISETCPLS